MTRDRDDDKRMERYMSRALLRGVLRGLSSAGALGLHVGYEQFTPPRYQGAGVEGAWRAVGRHLRKSMAISPDQGTDIDERLAG